LQKIGREVIYSDTSGDGSTEHFVRV
jgi:hypothetical protein